MLLRFILTLLQYSWILMYTESRHSSFHRCSSCINKHRIILKMYEKRVRNYNKYHIYGLQIAPYNADMHTCMPTYLCIHKQPHFYTHTLIHVGGVFTYTYIPIYNTYLNNILSLSINCIPKFVLFDFFLFS